MNLDEITHHPEAHVVTKFENAGLSCVIVCMRNSYYCGYVKTPFEGGYQEFQKTVDVHGGLTYGVDDDGWIGFDTMHAGDIPQNPDGSPLSNNAIANLTSDDHSKKWKPEDVMEETGELAEQISKLIPEGEIDDSEIIE